jgi:hypothetical protein
MSESSQEAHFVDITPKDEDAFSSIVTVGSKVEKEEFKLH